MSFVVTMDTAEFERDLALLSNAAQRFPEIRNRLVGLFEAGDEFVCLDTDTLAASVTNHLVVRLYPSDRLRGLVAAARARNSNLSLLDHALPAQVAAEG